MKPSYEELNKILAEHKLWIESDHAEGVRANLQCANLRDANLHRANLPDLTFVSIGRSLKWTDAQGLISTHVCCGPGERPDWVSEKAGEVQGD